jgi:hypothetical protein
MPSYWFPSIVALTTAVVVACCIVNPPPPHMPWDNPNVAKIIKERGLDRVAQGSSIENTNLDKLFDYQLKQYQASLATLETNLYLHAAFILFGLLVLFGSDEVFELPVVKLRLRRSWLYFIVPAVLLFLWLRFGFLLDGLIKTRLYGWELFLRLTPAASKEYIRSGGALFEDSGFMDGWFALFRNSNEHLIDPKLVDFNMLIFPSVFGVLMAANHAWILGLAYIGYARLTKKEQKQIVPRIMMVLLPWFMFLILICSNVLFYYGGPNPNWFQIFVPGMAIVLLFLLIFFWRWQNESRRTRLHA